ncbi:hypothetical protein NKI38_27525 [Mesorhizobium sp. M0621]|uniref:hypothetical protein n=1 Tax=Mesorhizobium sp. M0621 TaxID=2956974 RepID=UPI00333DFFC4
MDHLSMSTTNGWPKTCRTTRENPVYISDLADQAMQAAQKEGIEADEISEEVGSVFEVIFDAI